jgi:16S rRNA (guanine966-N2)-methyltransferase
MRVISGKAKGRKLKVPKTDKVRPTQDKVKEALFNILQDVRNLKILDLYAGAGAIGIEALSRGANEVVFIEQRPKLVHENLELTGLPGGRVYGTTVATALKVLNKHSEKFDIIFLDPPYDTDEALVTLNNISAFDILTPQGLVIAEHRMQKQLPETIGGLQRSDQRKYGQTVLSFYKMSNFK